MSDNSAKWTGFSFADTSSAEKVRFPDHGDCGQRLGRRDEKSPAVYGLIKDPGHIRFLRLDLPET